MSSIISAQLDEISVLAADLAALAAELDGDAQLCRSAAAPLRAALGGNEGWRAGTVAVAWSSLVGLVAGRTGEAAGALVAAVAAYRAADAALADRVCALPVARTPR